MITSAIRGYTPTPYIYIGWYVLFPLVLGGLMDFETLLILEYEATFRTLVGAG